MKKLLLLLTLVIASQKVFAQTCTSIRNGSWNHPSTWSCGVVPTTGFTNIVVAHKVTIPNGGSTGNGSLTVRSGAELELIGQLNLGSDEPSCSNTLTIESGALVTAESNGQNERLKICGMVVLTGQVNPNGQGETIPPGGYAGPATFSRTGPIAQPVEILFFEGAVQNEAINLKWATSYEDSFDFFTIERSSDAKNWDALGTVKGSGNSTSIINYNFSDNLPLAGRAYYRLKATDFDGTVEYHNIITVVKEGAAKVSVHPNPLSGNQFKVSATIAPNTKNSLKIYSIVGKVVYKAELTEANSDYTLQKSLDPGLYIVMVESGNIKYQTKLTVK